MIKANSKQFKVTYKDTEAPILVPIEYKLMKELGMDRSGIHKVAIRELHNRRQKSMLNLIWGKREMVSVTIKMTPVQKQMLISMSQKYRMKIDDLVNEIIEENYASKKRR